MQVKILLPFLTVLMLSACATKRNLPPVPVGSDTASEFNEATGEDERVAALQRDLAASAGSDRVFFELDSSVLSAAAKQTLDRQAIWLRQRPSINFTIEGHCDERGTRDYNFALGQRRATAVANYFTAMGIAPTRIQTISYGKERPDMIGSDETSYSQNRRAVSIVVTGAE